MHITLLQDCEYPFILCTYIITVCTSYSMLLCLSAAWVCMRMQLFIICHNSNIIFKIMFSSEFLCNFWNIGAKRVHDWFFFYHKTIIDQENSYASICIVLSLSYHSTYAHSRKTHALLHTQSAVCTFCWVQVFKIKLKKRYNMVICVL